MLVKLNFTAAKPIFHCFRVLADIINTPSVTSVSELLTRATAASYASELLSSLDSANSLIIRTESPTACKAHVSGNPNTKLFEFTTEFTVFDDPTRKYYYGFTSADGAAVVGNYGESVSGGTIDSSGIPLSTAESSNSYTGTALTYATNNATFATFGTSAGTNNAWTFWCYITNDCMIIATNNGAAFTTGFGTTYGNTANYCGPFIMSQYTRGDYWNKASNNIIPVIYPNQRVTAGVGYGYLTSDINLTAAARHNPNVTSQSVASVPFRAAQLVNTLPRTSSTPVSRLYNTQVSITIAGRAFAEIPLLTSSSVTTAATSSWAWRMSPTTGTRIPNSTASSGVFGQYDIGWSLSYQGCNGGSMSERGGFYMFNGDYVPGDEYTVGGVTYMIWPVYNGYTNRVGIAIPKE